MKLIALVANLLLCLSVHGSNWPDYSSSRKWVEKRCATNAIPKQDRVFIGYGKANSQHPEFAGIVRFHKGIKLREIIEQTPFKETTLTVYVLHESPKETEARFVMLRPSDNPAFEVRPLDVLWILDVRPSEPKGGANGSQPGHPETNSSQSAPASHRSP